MKKITPEILHKICLDARQSSRLRSHLNLHDSLEEDLQRLLIGMQPGTYIRPHYHPESYKKETIVILQGSCLCVGYAQDGSITAHTLLKPGGNMICEFADQSFHSLLCLAEDTVVLEFKKGPYEPLPAECFAAWAPPENDPEAAAWIKQLIQRLDSAV